MCYGSRSKALLMGETWMFSYIGKGFTAALTLVGPIIIGMKPYEYDDQR